MEVVMEKNIQSENIQKVALNTMDSVEIPTDDISKTPKIISIDDFIKKLSLTSLETLQKYSEECRETLCSSEQWLEINELSDNMPAVITYETEIYPAVIIKYPTYKIRIQNRSIENNDVDCTALEKLLVDITNRTLVIATRCEYTTIGNSITGMKIVPNDFPYCYEVTCLEKNLVENKACKDKIVQILENNGYRVKVYPSIYNWTEKIELSPDKKRFKVAK